jgi:hypothetical protein
MVRTVTFVRRVNADSTIDSICLSCYQTIASAQCEEDLILAEDTLECQRVYIAAARYTDSQRGTF